MNRTLHLAILLSLPLFDRAAEKAPGRIRYVEHHDHCNLGMSASRNAGIREARGEYLAFLDSDDVYLPGRLARHVEILDAMPQVAMVQSDHIQWYSWAGERDQADDDFVRPAVAVGDRIVIHGHKVGEHDRDGELQDHRTEVWQAGKERCRSNCRAYIVSDRRATAVRNLDSHKGE